MLIKDLARFTAVTAITLGLLGTETQAQVFDDYVTDQIISTYVGGYQGNGNLDADARWGYHWNAPAGYDPVVAETGPSGDGTTNPFGDPANYTELTVWNHPLYGDFYTPVTYFPVRANDDVAGYGRMGRYDGHVAAGSGQPKDINNQYDRYMIASFDIDTAGTYGITNSWLQVPDFGSTGIEVAVHVNDGPILNSIVLPGGTTGFGGIDGNGFETLLGELVPGDVVYVGFGADSDDASDFYIMDFAISTLTLSGGLEGDLNSDGFVGIADLNIVLGAWNQNVTPGDPLQGDPNGDGFVGIADLNLVLGNWNAGTPPVTSVPEPTAFALLTVGLAAVNLRPRTD